MCGIIGLFTRSPPADLPRRLAAGLAALRNRGPDDSGQEIIAVAGGSLGLGHTRLSIIDVGRAPAHVLSLQAILDHIQWRDL